MCGKALIKIPLQQAAEHQDAVLSYDFCFRKLLRQQASEVQARHYVFSLFSAADQTPKNVLNMQLPIHQKAVCSSSSCDCCLPAHNPCESPPRFPTSSETRWGKHCGETSTLCWRDFVFNHGAGCAEIEPASSSPLSSQV